ncbi:DUF2490 domain-containing protein [Qipengyuania sediminis]|uniref:DUF2490 domain-containing protein n=1 Tax=Qipengyuania sediminis TaxID=1532023 RepID=UPI00105A8C40|nr:DUF2490 domain-containing protein [Qipengyuania sediminis]
MKDVTILMRLLLLPLLFMTLAAPANATREQLELWLNPSATVAIDDRTFVELETAQRFRPEPSDDTIYARLWLGRDIAEDVTLSSGIERRHEGDGREVRFLQQLSYPLGPLGGRTRLEQRLIEGDPDTAWRLRQRIGGAIPLSAEDGGWQLVGNVEGFFVIRASEPGAQSGLTGVRSFIGFEREVGKVELSLGYLRQQTVRNDAPDTIGHAPFIGVGLSF